MIRFAATLFAAAVLASAAKADLPPPSPPMGKKYVSVNNEVILGKDVTGYVFVQMGAHGPGAPMFFYHKVELTPGKAVEIHGDGRYGLSLYAVPEAAAKEFKTNEELCRAVDKGKVQGAHSIGFTDTTTVSRLVMRNSVKWTTTITGIDANGIKTKVEGEGWEPPESPGKNDKLHARGWPCATFGAVSLGMLFGGLWRVSRTRRKV